MGNRGGVLPKKLATDKIGITQETNSQDGPEKKSANKNTPLFYIRNVWKNTYFHYSEYYRRCGLIGWA